MMLFNVLGIVLVALTEWRLLWWIGEWIDSHPAVCVRREDRE